MKFLRFLLISSLLLGCRTQERKENNSIVDSLKGIDMDADKRVDSIMKVLSANPNLKEEEILSIHEVLQKIIEDKQNALIRLEKINQHMDTIESVVKTYVLKKKASVELKNKLLSDIQRLKDEMSGIKPKTLKEIIQKPLPNSLRTLYGLDPGNYMMRLDKYHILKFFVSDKHELFVAPLTLDSTTVLNGAALDPKVVEQIKKMREQLNN